MTVRRAIALVIMACAMIGRAAVAAAGQTSIEASPLRVEIQTEPGRTFTQAVTIRNPGIQTVRVRTSIADWHLSKEGAPQFEPPVPDRRYAAASWVRFAPPEFTLGAGKEGTVRFTLDVPAGAEPAGYRTALLFEFLPETPDPAAGRQVIVRSRIATLIYVNVGQPPSAIEMTNLEVRGSAEQTAIVAALRNSSRRTVRTKGTLVVYDGTGVAVAKIVVPDVPVLPESERELAIRAADAVAALLPGTHRVELTLDLGMPALIVGETTLRVDR